jgi:hypothetical protein
VSEASGDAFFHATMAEEVEALEVEALEVEALEVEALEKGMLKQAEQLVPINSWDWEEEKIGDWKEMRGEQKSSPNSSIDSSDMSLDMSLGEEE